MMRTVGVVWVTLGLLGCASDGSSGASGAAENAGDTSAGGGGDAASGGSGNSGATPSSGGGDVASGGATSSAGGAPETTGSGAPPSSDGGAPNRDGGAPNTGGGAACEKSTVQPDEVVFIGDSFIAEPTSDIAPDLETLFQSSGSSAYEASPRYYQFVGTNMNQIATQFDQAVAANPDIKVVIGDGGGNDVLILDRSCLTQAPPANATCAQTVATALAEADALMSKMEAAGVEHFLYFFYPHERTEGLYQGTAPAINDSLDYAEPKAKAVCDKHPICTFVSLREAAGDAIGSGYTDRGYISPNDVHPSAAGSQFFAEAIWKTMQANCILNS